MTQAYREILDELFLDYNLTIVCEEYIEGVDITMSVLEDNRNAYVLGVLCVLDKDSMISYFLKTASLLSTAENSPFCITAK